MLEGVAAYYLDGGIARGIFVDNGQNHLMFASGGGIRCQVDVA